MIFSAIDKFVARLFHTRDGGPSHAVRNLAEAAGHDSPEQDSDSIQPPETPVSAKPKDGESGPSPSQKEPSMTNVPEFPTPVHYDDTEYTLSGEDKRPGWSSYEAPPDRIIEAVRVRIWHVTRYGYSLSNAIGNDSWTDIRINHSSRKPLALDELPPNARVHSPRVGETWLVFDVESRANDSPLARGAIRLAEAPPVSQTTVVSHAPEPHVDQPRPPRAGSVPGQPLTSRIDPGRLHMARLSAIGPNGGFLKKEDIGGLHRDPFISPDDTPGLISDGVEVGDWLLFKLRLTQRPHDPKGDGLQAYNIRRA